MLGGVAVPLLIFEVLVYGLLGLCFWHALYQGALRRARLIELGTGVLYGLTLEVSTIFLLHAYQYGHFLIMFGPVPLAVTIGWSIILYSAMAFADALTLPSWAAPALVGLLGLNIDLSMDAIAIRLHMWQWHGIASPQQWFGVPYANFYAWVIVLCSASALLWWGRPLTARPGWRGPLAALGALGGSLLILTLLDELVVQYDAHDGILWLPVVMVVTGALVVVGWGLWSMHSSARPSPTRSILNLLLPMLVPLSFHLYFLITLFVTHIAAHLPALLVIALSMLVVSLVVHGVCWLLGTSVRKFHSFLRTDVPNSQHTECFLWKATLQPIAKIGAL
jgi:hypothetical protein